LRGPPPFARGDLGSGVIRHFSPDAFAVVNNMSPASKRGADDRDRLIDLAHLSSAVGHYLINAYSATVSNSELIRSPISRLTDAREPAVLATSIIDTALYASNVARKLIDWARIEGALELFEPNGEPRMVDLNQLIGDFVETERRSGAPGIEWQWSPGSIAPVPADRHQLWSMLARFVENAREALPAEGGTIGFSTQTDARDWIVLTIRDSGCGMSHDVQRHAGEPFFSTKEDHAGVGLTIAQLIWRRHRGAFSIESSPGAGTVIRLSILPSAIAPVSPPRPMA
jgi:two-component system, NtrC family, sensor kinase